MKPILTASALTLALMAGTAIAQEKQQGSERGGAPGASERSAGSERSGSGPGGGSASGGSSGSASERADGDRGRGAAGEKGSAQGGAQAQSERGDRERSAQGQGQNQGQGGGKKASDDSKNASGQGSDKNKANRASDDDNKSDKSRNTTAGSNERDRTDGDRNRNAAGNNNNNNNNASTNAGTAGSSGQNTGAASSQNDRDQAGNRNADANRQGSSSTTRVNVSEQQRTQLRSVLRDDSVKRNRSNVNIRVSVGERVPRNVDLRPLPPRIVEIVPEYRSYRYVYSEDRVVIIDPDSYEVVYVIDEDGSPARSGAKRTTASLELSADEKRFIKQHIDMDRRRADIRFERSVGKDVPRSVELISFEGQVVDRIPRLKEFRYVVVERDVVIIDPDDREIVTIVN